MVIYYKMIKPNKRYLTFLIIGYLCVEVFSQAIGHTTVTFVDESRNNRPIQTEIYYPATAAGNNTPISTGVYPLIVFGHGFLMTWTAYENIWTTLVPKGYIVVFPTTESGFAPSHANFGQDLKFLEAKIKSSGAGTAVPFSSLANTSAIMGHSMGGGSAFLAAANNASVTTLVTFAAANTNPSSVVAAKEVTVPTLVFSATNDCITPPSQHQDIMYDTTLSILKTQVYIKGGSHCYFANDNIYCSIGESTCTPAPTITREEQQSTTSDFLIQWLEYFLKSNCEEAIEFQDSLQNSDRIGYRQSQGIACTSSTTGNIDPKNGLSIYPNPNQGEFTINSSFEIKSISVTDSMGNVVTSFYGPGHVFPLNLSHLTGGVYFISIAGKNGESHIEKLIIK